MCHIAPRLEIYLLLTLCLHMHDDMPCMSCMLLVYNFCAFLEIKVTHMQGLLPKQW